MLIIEVWKFIATLHVCGMVACLPVYLFYFHVNGSIGIVQKIDFELRPDSGCTTLKTSNKVVLNIPSLCMSVCVSVCLSVRLSDCLSCYRFSRELSQAYGLTDQVETLGVCLVT